MWAVIKHLDGVSPLLYAAMRAIGPRQLTEEETKNTARRVFQNNPGLTSAQIGKAIGRTRQTVDSYIGDLRAAVQQEVDLKLFRMYRLGIPQDRIAKRLGEARKKPNPTGRRAYPRCQRKSIWNFLRTFLP